MRRVHHRQQAGITLPEVLVLVGIVTILICLLLPALIRGREQARTNLCESRVTQLIRGVQEFESNAGAFPAGCINPTGPIANTSEGTLHHGWHSQLLPYLGEEALFSRIDPKLSVYHEDHRPVRETMVPAFACPASPRPDLDQEQAVIWPSSYAASYHSVEEPLDVANNGVFFVNSRLTKSHIEDGEKYTLFLGEIRLHEDNDNLGWMSGTRATLRNTAKPPGTVGSSEDIQNPYFMGSFGSWHAGFAHMAMGDGRVAAMSESIDAKAFQQLGGRNDGSMDRAKNE